MVRARVKAKNGRVILDVAEGVTITAKRPFSKQNSSTLRYQRSRSTYLSKRLRDLESAIASGVINNLHPNSSGVGSVQLENPFQVQEQLTTATITAASKARLEQEMKSIIAQLEKIERQSAVLNRLPKTFNDTIQKEYATRKSMIRSAVSSKRVSVREAGVRALALRAKYVARISQFRQQYENKLARVSTARTAAESSLLAIRRQLEDATQASYQVRSLRKQLRKR